MVHKPEIRIVEEGLGCLIQIEIREQAEEVLLVEVPVGTEVEYSMVVDPPWLLIVRLTALN